MTGTRRFERHVRALARRTMRPNREVWKEYKRRRVRPWRRTSFLPSSAWTALWMIWLLMAATAEPQRVTTALAFYGITATLIRTHTCLTELFGGGRRQMLLPLPISDVEFLRRETQKYAKRWVTFSVVVLAAFLVTVVRHTGSPHWTLILGLATAMTVLGMSMSVILMRHGRSLLRPLVWLSVGALAVWTILASDESLAGLWAVAQVSPFAWITRLLFTPLSPAAAFQWWPIVPVLGLVGFAIFVWPQLRQELEALLIGQTAIVGAPPEETPAEQEVEFSPEQIPQSVFDQPMAAAAPATEEKQAEATPAVEDVPKFDPSVLAPPDWFESGWVQRLIARSLDSRERTVAEMMAGAGIRSWSKSWLRGTQVAGVTALLALSVPGAPPLLVVLPFIASCFIGMPLLGGIWTGFTGPSSSGFTTPMYAVFPVGYSRLSSVVLKICWIRIVLWGPIFVGGAAVLARHLHYAIVEGAIIGLLLLLLILAVQPILLLLHVSSMSNDTRHFRWSVAGLVVLVLFLAASGATTAVLMFVFSSSIPKLLGLWLTFCAQTLLLWYVYGLAYNRSSFDLLSSPQQNS